jgi:GTP-binding protein Era
MNAEIYVQKNAKGKSFSSGFVSLIGRPNVGKSTLLNAIIGEKLSIISNKPQTTRNMIKGIVSEPDCQVIFLDTPGIHDAKAIFNKRIVSEALSALKHIDLILFLTEPSAKMSEEDEYILSELKNSNVTKVLVVNKIDRVDKAKLLPFVDMYKEKCDFSDVFLISALKNDGVDTLLGEIKKRLPEGAKYFDDEYITDCPERFLAAEIIREKVFNLTQQEIPYSTAVVVETFKEKYEKNLVVIDATIIVEKDSQKGIIIGSKGRMLKKIGADSRKDIEELLNVRVFLKLFVKVSKNWTKSEQKLKEFGY